MNRLFKYTCVLLTALLSLSVVGTLGHVFVAGPQLSIMAVSTLNPMLAVSLETSLASALLAMLLGTPVAYVLARGRFVGKAVIETILDLPVALPPMVAGLALLVVFSPSSPFGSVLDALDVRLIFTKPGIVLAQLFVALPFYIRAVRHAIASIPPSIPAAAALLRASEAYAFFHVILPLSRAGIVSGFVMCWTRALGEFGATAMVAGCIPGVTETLPVAIYMRATACDLATAGAAASLLAGVSFVTLVLLRMVLGDDNATRRA
jgi:molybdate transport system permease protein